MNFLQFAALSTQSDLVAQSARVTIVLLSIREP